MKHETKKNRMRLATMAWNCRRFCLVLVVAVAFTVNMNFVSTNDALSRGTSELSTGTLKGKPSDSYQHKRKHDFSYDRETWDKNRPRIAILAGPHKTASTTLQTFFVELTGLTVQVKNSTQEATSIEFKTPIYPNTEWVWPIGVKSEYEDEFKTMKKNLKFYASMTPLLFGRRKQMFFPAWRLQTKDEREKSRERVMNYWRELFKRPWEDGKKILIAAESFDSLVLGLTENPTVIGNRGEEMHVSPDSSDMIDALLGLFPWDEPNTKGQRSEDANDNSQKRPLRLEDIEIHINYRTPRIDHVVSIWHQLGGRKSLKRFVEDMGTKGSRGEKSFYQLNSLALALQFVRKGIKTTIVDMKGFYEKEAKDSTRAIKKNDLEKTTNETIVGGLQGVVACDILKMGIDSTSAAAAPVMFCDDKSKLHLSNYDAAVESKNQKHDNGRSRNVTDKQMEEINQVFEEYDCGVWKHVKKYQEQGLLRILYPSEHLFETCNSKETNLDVSFLDSLKKAKEIVSCNDDASNS